MPAVCLREVRREIEGSFDRQGKESSIQESAVSIAKLKRPIDVKQSGQVGELRISFFQQFPRFSDLSRLGDDIHHDVVVHLDDVRDAAKARDGDTGVANHRILLRYLYEHRTCIKDPGRRSVFHS